MANETKTAGKTAEKYVSRHEHRKGYVSIKSMQWYYNQDQDCKKQQGQRYYKITNVQLDQYMDKQSDEQMIQHALNWAPVADLFITWELHLSRIPFTKKDANQSEYVSRHKDRPGYSSIKKLQWYYNQKQEDNKNKHISYYRLSNVNLDYYMDHTTNEQMVEHEQNLSKVEDVFKLWKTHLSREFKLDNEYGKEDIHPSEIAKDESQATERKQRDTQAIKSAKKAVKKTNAKITSALKQGERAAVKAGKKSAKDVEFISKEEAEKILEENK